MDKEKQKEMKKNQELIDHYDYLKNAASSNFLLWYDQVHNMENESMRSQCPDFF